MTANQDQFSDKYFVRAREILVADQYSPQVLMQLFCRSTALLCGVDEALELAADLKGVTVHSLSDGDPIAPWETVMTLQGPYIEFASLETQILGILARGTRVASQTQELVSAANHKPVLFFGARHDHYANQFSDGHAAIIGGAIGVATDAQGARSHLPGVGTMPHALIAAYGGDTVLAAEKFVQHMPTDIPFIALVDFDNDCAGTSVAVARALEGRLAGVRLDTSSNLVDHSLGDSGLTGVHPILVQRVRAALDHAGFNDVEIVVSGGITAQRIATFEASGAPVDAYGVGSAILRNNGDYDFTADIVAVNGQPLAKVGRRLSPNPRLRQV